MCTSGGENPPRNHCINNQERTMINTKRGHLNKHKSAAKFRSASHKTHPRNMAVKPMRGGWRL